MSYHVRHCIGKPQQAHGVDSEAAYLLHAKRFLLRHGIPPSVMTEATERPPAYVSGGWWVVKCPCGNAPAAHPGGEPGWPRPIAVCLECGAIYRPTFPKDHAEAEAALLERPDPATRHYFPHEDCAAWVGEGKGQTVAYLRKENRDRAADLQRDRARFRPHDGEPA